MDRLTPAIVVLTANGLDAGHRAARAIGGEVHGLAGRVGGADISFEQTIDHLQDLFLAGRPIVGICAAGILIRALAPLLASKHDEPPVVAVSPDGAHCVPLLGGHHGANELAGRIADALDGSAALTTAGDRAFGVALDAPPPGWVLANPGDAKTVMAYLLAGASARIEGELPWLARDALPIDDTGSVRLVGLTEPVSGDAATLVYHPLVHALGVGCARHCPPEELNELVDRVCAQANISIHSIACVATIDLKADEQAVGELADRLARPLRLFDAARLEPEADRLANPSETVFAEVGCHGVAEGAALAAVGEKGQLIVEKTKTGNATAALAIAPAPIDVEMIGRARGQVALIGIGPGRSAWRTPEATRLVAQADEIVGYSLYNDLLGPLAPTDRRRDFPIGAEEDRVRHALESAATGKSVALVCSGDAGIYAMAALAWELIDRESGEGGVSDAARRVDIVTAPGISAMQAAAARAGAPLGHDFCAISLSDLLTPWPDIENRIEAAAAGDFVIAFYNPVSRRRRTQLAAAKKILLRHRPPDCPVILASNLGRPEETVRVLSLAELQVDNVDMLTLVMVGSSNTRRIERGDGTTKIYTPRGYAAKLSHGEAAE